jgi:hypothetical protein
MGNGVGKLDPQTDTYVGIGLGVGLGVVLPCLLFLTGTLVWCCMMRHHPESLPEWLPRRIPWCCCCHPPVQDDPSDLSPPPRSQSSTSYGESRQEGDVVEGQPKSLELVVRSPEAGLPQAYMQPYPDIQQAVVSSSPVRTLQLSGLPASGGGEVNAALYGPLEGSPGRGASSGQGFPGESPVQAAARALAAARQRLELAHSMSAGSSPASATGSTSSPLVAHSSPDSLYPDV